MPRFNPFLSYVYLLIEVRMSVSSLSDRPLPSLGAALVPIVFLVLCLSGTVYVFGGDSTSGPVQIVLIFSTAVAAVGAYRFGTSWTGIQESIKRSVSDIASGHFYSTTNRIALGDMDAEWCRSYDYLLRSTGSKSYDVSICGLLCLICSISSYG